MSAYHSPVICYAAFMLAFGSRRAEMQNQMSYDVESKSSMHSTTDPETTQCITISLPPLMPFRNTKTLPLKVLNPIAIVS